MKRNREAMRQYERAMSVLQSESAPDSLRQLEQEFDGFPEGVDPYIGRRWIISAIDVGSLAIEEWIETARELGRTVPQPKGRLLYA